MLFIFLEEIAVIFYPPRVKIYGHIKMGVALEIFFLAILYRFYRNSNKCRLKNDVQNGSLNSLILMFRFCRGCVIFGKVHPYRSLKTALASNIFCK